MMRSLIVILSLSLASSLTLNEQQEMYQKQGLLGWAGVHDLPVGPYQLSKDRKTCFRAQRWWNEQLDAKYGLGTHSERDQDARLMSLFSKGNVGTTNKFYVEFGFTGLDNSMTERLRVEAGFTGYRMDGGEKNLKQQRYQHFITPDNIVELFKQHDTPKEPDYVSIDIDSTDVKVFKNLTKEFHPRVVTIEYMASHPLEKEVETAHGSSLGAVLSAADEMGYTVVGVEPNQDAFLVRKDLVCAHDDVNPEQFAKFTAHQKPHWGVPEDRVRRCGFKHKTTECPMEWTLRDFPYQNGM